jgi:hypothetical protein
MNSFRKGHLKHLDCPSNRQHLSHPDKAVQKHFRLSFGKYYDNSPGHLPLVAKTCPFCSAELITTKHTFLYEDDPDSELQSSECVTIIDDSFDFASIDSRDPCDDGREFCGALEYCLNCRYWRFHYTKTDHFPREFGLTLAYSSLAAKIKEYECDLPDGVTTEVAAWLRRKPSAWHTMSPTRFERLIADVFRRNYSSAEVIHVGRPDDGGVDVLLVESNGCQWLIQAKRRESPYASEGISTIRNLLGAMVLDGASHGIVVSTADHFTYRARQAVRTAQQRDMVLRLVDRRAFDRMLDRFMPDRPWVSPLIKRFPIFGYKFAEQIESHKQLRLFD